MADTSTPPVSRPIDWEEELRKRLRAHDEFWSREAGRVDAAIRALQTSSRSDGHGGKGKP